MIECPDCGKLLPDKVKRCSCGWYRTIENASTVANHRCKYQLCESIGTISRSLYGNTAWYCREHDQALAEKKLREIEMKYSKKIAG